MRIATWNVNGIRARLEFVLHWLDARAPDAVALQELKVEESEFPAEPFEAAGYRAVVHAQKGWNGVAVLARVPVEPISHGLPGEEAFGARVVTARVGSGAAAIDLTSVYVPNGKRLDHDDYPRKLRWLDTFAAHLGEADTDGRAAIVGGDFNVVPADIDTWDADRLRGQLFHTDEERRRFRAVLDAGYIDLFREHRPEAHEFSWWDYRGGAFHRRMGLRIDFLLGTPTVAGRVRAVTIDRDYRKKKDGMTPSDHAPVIVDFGD